MIPIIKAQDPIFLTIESFIIEFEKETRNQSVIFYSEEEEKKFLKAVLKVAASCSERNRKMHTKKLYAFIKVQRLKSISKHSIEEIDRIVKINQVIHKILMKYQIIPSEQVIARSDNPFRKIPQKIITQFDESLSQN